MTEHLRTELKSEIDQLNGNLNRLFDKLDMLDQDIKSLSADTKEIKSDVAGQGREISKVQATLLHNADEVKKMWGEIQNIWNHFRQHKEDIKEYAGIIAKQEADKIKIWVYSLLGLGSVMIITNLISWVIKK